ncbi:MAG: trypsin-like peptidase domain-containing protein [Burkholderiales bacterium]
MRSTPLYSRAKRAGPATAPGTANAPERNANAPRSPQPSRRRRLQAQLTRPRMLWAAWLLMLALGLLAFWQMQHHLPTALTQDDIDRAVLHTLTHQSLPSPTARAYEAIAPSVVRVLGHVKKREEPASPGAKTPRPTPKDNADDATEPAPSVGTGVVILDNGTILTNLHVVQGADWLTVEFANGLVASADVVRVDGNNDLAVIRARRIPDDLQAATLRGSSDLRPGDAVVVVGFPFGIGPSVSAGVVSGLHRQFRAGNFGEERRGGRLLNDLIQFDAAANPGNSGGPLVNQDGEVLGIVTAILNPNEQRTFIGIGFAVPIESAAAAVGIPPF